MTKGVLWVEDQRHGRALHADGRAHGYGARWDGEIGEETMTLAELARETLTQKNIRLRQRRCRHKEIYSSVTSRVTGGLHQQLLLGLRQVVAF